jgi:25S rRNA (adenine2142-N1)-methyltransferase
MDETKENHLKLASIIKGVHSDLRISACTQGADKSWRQHLEDKNKLKLYAQSMNELNEKHWKKNSSKDDRIEWIVKYCREYFRESELQKHKNKELRTVEKLNICYRENNCDIDLQENLKVLDVGSCGNYFKQFEIFNVIAIDIAPAVSDVLYCDFISVPVADTLKLDTEQLHQLPESHFDIVIFCLLLEYLPTSEMRIKCCEKAYQVLNCGGILIIITPDSNYQHVNAKQIKTWQYVLAKLGFRRIKIEKLTNLTCMAFRKSIAKEISQQWAEVRDKELFANFKMEIPQERQK